MRIRKLKLNNFRNFSESEITISDGTTIFFGGVGEGKTNLIEAIFMLSVGRSYRTTEMHQVISWGKNEAYVRGEGQNSCGSFSVGLKVTKSGKRIELNGEQNRKTVELVGGLRSVIFHGDDTGIVAGPPQTRRRFLDIAVSQASKNYLYKLRDYYRALKQRNSALLTIKHSNICEWDEQLSTIGSWITQIRATVLAEISQRAGVYVGAIAGEEKALEIRYAPSGSERSDEFNMKLSKAIKLDIARGSTSVGPHRDDFKIMLDGADARHYASSGEKKTIALSIKLAEVEFMRSVTGEKPILLMDDVFSSLDLKRSKSLMGVTGDGSQCIITLTDLNLLRSGFGSGAALYEVKQGRISQ